VLTTLGIVISAASVVVLVALGTCTHQRIEEKIERLGTQTLMIQPGSLNAGGTRMGDATHPTLTEEDARAIAAEVQDVITAAPTSAIQDMAGYLRMQQAASSALTAPVRREQREAEDAQALPVARTA
jgi:putative ABC transport system permease protein